MTSVTGAPSPIVVDKRAGQTNGRAGMKYEKERDQELWERVDARRWSLINPHVRTELGDVADGEGTFAITLRPGQSYELGVFEREHGPTAADPIQRAGRTLFCPWKRPEVSGLITDENRATFAPVQAKFVRIEQTATATAPWRCTPPASRRSRATR